MKIIFNNKYVELVKFNSFREFSTFINNQNLKKSISLNESYGDLYYCCIFYDSLTKERLCIISFQSNQSENNLHLLVWQNTSLFILDTGTNLYLLNDNFTIKASFEITSPLMGLYLTRENNLLILEETSVRLINSDGQILKSELFDLIEDFSLKNEILSIKVNGVIKAFKLI